MEIECKWVWVHANKNEWLNWLILDDNKTKYDR